MSRGLNGIAVQPPEGLIRAQRFAIMAAEAACAHANLGIAESKFAAWADKHASQHGASGVRTATLSAVVRERFGALPPRSQLSGSSGALTAVTLRCLR